jgi:hypothetical protein
MNSNVKKKNGVNDAVSGNLDNAEWGHCAFCGTYAELSPEDVWSRWLSKFMRGADPKVVFAQYFFTEIGDNATPKYGQTVQLIAPVVCTPCNNGWMAGLERCVKQLLTSLIRSPRKPLTLTDTDRLAIAAWITCKAITLDHRSIRAHGTKPFFTPRQRRAFMDSFVPPSRVSVFLGHLGSPTASGDIATFYLNSNQQTVRHLHGYVLTFSAHEIAIQFVATKLIGNAAKGALDRIPYVYDPKVGLWSDLAPQIWPYVSGSSWPPLRSFGEDGFRRFACRLGGTPISLERA